jgi:hypothetical protein
MASQSPRDLFSRLLAAVMALVGAVFLLSGLGLGVREAWFGQHALPASGTVTEVRVSDSGEGPNYSPVVAFRTGTGEEVRFEGISTSPPPQTGQTVPVLYHPDAPQAARIDRFVDRWLFPALFVLLGFLMLLGSRYAWRHDGFWQ